MNLSVRGARTTPNRVISYTWPCEYFSFQVCRGGGIGRRARFRTWWAIRPWRFKSSPRHHHPEFWLMRRPITHQGQSEKRYFFSNCSTINRGGCYIIP